MAFSFLVLFLSWVHAEVRFGGGSNSADASGFAILQGAVEYGQNLSAGGTQIGIVLFLLGALISLKDRRWGIVAQICGLILFPLGWPTGNAFISYSVGSGYLLAWIVVVAAGIYIFWEDI